jgi:hypothetical protein
MSAPGINVRIKELKISGLSAGQRGAIHQAIQRELARLVATNGMPRSLAWGRRLAPRPPLRIEAEPGMKADDIAARVAGSIYRGLGGGKP